MNNVWVAGIIGLVDFLVGLAAGITIMWRRKKPPDAEQIIEFMDKVVNVEMMEERDKLNKVRMARNNRKTTRMDSGPNATVTRMRLGRPRRR